MSRRFIGWIMRKALPGIAVTAVLLVTLAALGEIYLRRTVPFRSGIARDFYAEGAGLMTYKPGSEFRSTNSMSYWTAETVNAQGFLEREPRAQPNPAACRIVIIGDSLIEAQQVPIAVKVQVRLETYLSEALHRPVEVVAAGVAGIGQVNQLAYLPMVVRPVQPALVILVATHNDFSNNSAVLSALRYGWHPDHMLRYYLRRDAATGEVIQVGPDMNGNKHYLLIPVAGPALPRAQRNRWLSAHSYLYDWLFRIVARKNPGLLRWLDPNAMTGPQLEVRRMEQIKAIPHYRHVFDGWNYPDDLWDDYVFHTGETGDLPPLFSEAEWLTRYAFQAFREAGADQGFHVLVAADAYLTTLDDALQDLIRAAGGGDALTRDGVLTRPVRVHGRTIAPKGGLVRLKRIAGDLGLPVVDLHDELVRLGPLANTRVPFDGHWSAAGHDRVARVLASYISSHPGLCDGRGDASH